MIANPKHLYDPRYGQYYPRLKRFSEVLAAHEKAV